MRTEKITPSKLDYAVAVGKIVFMAPEKRTLARYCTSPVYDYSLIEQLANERMIARHEKHNGPTEVNHYTDDVSSYTGVNGLDVMGS